jgi:hypothetical protein
VVPYDAQRVAKIKTFIGRRWHQEEKYWTVPHTEGAVARLQALFAAEAVFVVLQGAENILLSAQKAYTICRNCKTHQWI